MRHVMVVLLVATIGLVGTAGCGAATQADAAGWETAAATGPEEAALRALGYEIGDPPPGDAESPTDRWGDRRDRHAVRVALRRNALHGEAVVRTATGTRTVLFQRGTVAGLTDETVTVESEDGFTQAWTLDPEVRVIEVRRSVEAQQLQVGDPVGLAGVRPEQDPVARLIVIDRR